MKSVQYPVFFQGPGLDYGGGMGNLELEKSLQNHPHGTELEAKRKCTFSGENNVERTEILHFTVLPKNLL